jgi:hypothetical protein
MKNLKTLLALLLLALFSCENSSDDKTSSNLSDTQIVELAESFDQDEESLTDDMDDAFGSFDAQFKTAYSRSKVLNPRTYDTLSGFWTKLHEKTGSRLDSVRRDELLVVRNFSFDYSKTVEVRFSDIANASIQYPKNDKEAITKIEMKRDGSFSTDGTVSVYGTDGVLIEDASEKTSHKDKNGSSVLEKMAETDGLWSLNGSGEKSVSFTTVKNGETKSFDRSVAVKMDSVIVKHAGAKGRKAFGKKVRAQIIAGVITRTIENVEGSTLVIRTEYFDCEVEVDKKRLTRTITKDGVLVKEVSVYCDH